MCVEIPQGSEPETLKEDLIAWKCVRRHKSGYSSSLRPDFRMIQDGFPSPGTRRVYKLGKRMVSWFKRTPGFYLYANKRTALWSLGVRNCHTAILKVKIPAGSKILKAYKNHDLVILAEQIIPLEEV